MTNKSVCGFVHLSSQMPPLESTSLIFMRVLDKRMLYQISDSVILFVIISKMRQTIELKKITDVCVPK